MPPEMRRTTVRVPDHFHQLIEEEAEASGLSVAAIYREAMMARLIWGRAVRGENEYAIAHQIVAISSQQRDAVVGIDVVADILEHLPMELDLVLRACDERAPNAAAWLRAAYQIPGGGFSRDSMVRRGGAEPRR